MEMLKGVRSKTIGAQVTSRLHKAFKLQATGDGISMRQALEQLLTGYVTGSILLISCLRLPGSTAIIGLSSSLAFALKEWVFSLSSVDIASSKGCPTKSTS